VILLADTGVFSAAYDTRGRVGPNDITAILVRQTVLLAEVTVAELRYGAIRAGWGPARRARQEAAIATVTRVPVTDALVTTVAELRAACRAAAHPLHEKLHIHDLWIAASAVHIDVPLVTFDRIFEGTPGLSVVPVAAPLVAAPVDVAARMTAASGVHGVPLPDDATRRPPMPEDAPGAAPPPGQSTAVGTLDELTDFYLTRMSAEGWSLDTKHSSLGPWKLAKHGFGVGVHMYFDRGDVSVYVAILPSPEVYGEHTILVMEVSD
jgi:predicted nucleic acid-binding protein